MKILEICTALDGGGVDRYLLNYCSRIKDVHFDFVAVSGKEGILEEPLRKFGFNIFKVPRITKGVIKNYKALKRIMLQGGYDVVHSHLGHKSIVALLCAKRCGIKVRITHAHIAFIPESFIAKSIRKICTFFTKKLSTSLVACGVDAGKWLWGEKEYAEGNVTVFNNAIETANYAFSLSNREEKRKELGIGDETVFCSIGRISDQKNQPFALEIFKEILEIRPNSTMIFIGRGERENDLKKRAEELGISHKVKFLGIRDDVPKLLSAMDVMLFPSLYEGLPFTLVESQCNGLYTLCSDTVTELVKYSESIVFKSLELSPKEWAKDAVALAAKGHFLLGKEETVTAGYDIDTEASKLKEYYFEKVNRCTTI